MSRNVVVTGVGVVSALGIGVAENCHALRQGRSGIAPVELLPTLLKNEFVLGEVKFSNTELKAMLGIDANRLVSRTTLLALLAGKEAIASAGLQAEDLAETALISGTTVGGMDLTETVSDFDQAENLKAILDLHSCGDSTEKMADFFAIEGFITTCSTACSSAANAIMMGARLIKSGRAKRVVAGGTDALSRFTLNGFNSLLILDKEPCRPFDKTRAGINLGEGAGYVVLEAEEFAKPDRVLARLSGYANANDAFHQTASSPEGVGATLSMQKALEMAGLNPDDISYINAHGTGTPNNDSSEVKAIAHLFGEDIAYSSTKAHTGHTLAACGGIEAVFAVQAILEQERYAGLNFSEQDEDVQIKPLAVYQTAEINHVLSNSFGFGGNNSTLIFSKK